MTNMKKTFISIAAFLAVLTLSSCATVKEVPENLSAAQIIQLGQTAFEQSDYKTAELYYKTVLDRYGTSANVLVEAKYELAHVYLKQKKYDQAYPIYTEILNLYEENYAGSLPQAYKKLAQIGINQIPENKKTSVNPSEAE